MDGRGVLSHPERRPIRVVLFDLDDTLYPRGAGVMDRIRVLMLDYIETRLGLGPEEADALRRRYLASYGTTLRGLQRDHRIDAEEYLSHVHRIPLDECLEKNPALDCALASIPYDKVIFTNASREHAEGVLAALGIRQHFSRIVDVRDLDFESKPQPYAYERVCEMLGVAAEECVLVEDSVRNLQPAGALGMTTVLVGDGSRGDLGAADYAIERIEEIAQVLAAIDGREEGVEKRVAVDTARAKGEG